jgi:hypothetical protein
MKLFLFIIFLLPFSSFAQETCSRVATINYQKVLVDAGSNKKGEGLRFYLEKDPISEKLIDQYQAENKPTIFSASTSTAGSILVLAGLLQTNKSEGIQNNNTLIYGGSILIALSYLSSKTMKFNSERLLDQAVKQYNKRNSPKIYFSPFINDGGESSLGLGLQQEF